MNARLQVLGWKYYHFIGGGARFMCSWQTRDDEVHALLNDMSVSVLDPDLRTCAGYGVQLNEVLLLPAKNWTAGVR